MSRRIVQRIAAFRRTLWRSGTIVSLAVLLSLGVVEPLLCLIHCEIMVLRAEDSHAHMAAMLPMSGMAMADTAMHDMAMPGMHHDEHANQPASPEPPPGHVVACTMNHGSPNTDGVQPQPFHEMALLGVLLLFGAATLERRYRLPVQAPAQHFVRPPLRPPTFLPAFFTA